MEANTPQITLLLAVLGFFGTVECPSAMVNPIPSKEQREIVSYLIIKSEKWSKIAKRLPKLSASTISSEYRKSISAEKSKSRSSSINVDGSESGSPSSSFKYSDDFMTTGSDSDTEFLSDDNVLCKSLSTPTLGGSPSQRDYKRAALLEDVAKFYSQINLDKTNKGSCRVNSYLKKYQVYDGDPKIRLVWFSRIVAEMWDTVANDDCRVSDGQSWTGDGKCQGIYGEFKKIPAEYRGVCSTAISAQCSVLPCQAHLPTPQTACTFFVPTNVIRKSRKVEGAFISLQDCILDMKLQFFKQPKA